MSVILMTTPFYKALILQGEIWCWSLLGLNGLINLPSFPNNSFKSILQYNTALEWFYLTCEIDSSLPHTTIPACKSSNIKQTNKKNTCIYVYTLIPLYSFVHL